MCRERGGEGLVTLAKSWCTTTYLLVQGLAVHTFPPGNWTEWMRVKYKRIRANQGC